MTQLFTNHEWFNFPAYFHKTYRVIDIDKDVPDVTLACDDDANKVIQCVTESYICHNLSIMLKLIPFCHG